MWGLVTLLVRFTVIWRIFDRYVYGKGKVIPWLNYVQRHEDIWEVEV